jgi:hypothetical protein
VPARGKRRRGAHTRVLLAEHRLNEAIENAHRTGLSASDSWTPKSPPTSHVDTLALDARLRRTSGKGWPRGQSRPEHRAPLTGRLYGFRMPPGA